MNEHIQKCQHQNFRFSFGTSIFPKRKYSPQQERFVPRELFVFIFLRIFFGMLQWPAFLFSQRFDLSRFRSSFECYMIKAWFIHDTFMHVRYKLWQRNIFSFVFLDRSFDFQWILLMVSLPICYIYDTFLMHSWYIHDTFIWSLKEKDSIGYYNWPSQLIRGHQLFKDTRYIIGKSNFAHMPDIQIDYYLWGTNIISEISIVVLI